MESHQNGYTEFGYQSGFLQPEWSVPARVGLLAVGIASIVAARRMSPRLRWTLQSFGIASFIRALTNRNVTDLVGWIANPVLRLNRTIQIQANVDDVFDYLKNFSNYPSFMSYIREVAVNDQGGLRWTATGPGGLAVHWDTSVGLLQHNQAISWSSSPGSVIRNAGWFSLSEAPDGGTLLRAQFSFAPAVGILGYAVAQLLGFDPRSTMDHDLTVLKKQIEKKAGPYFDQHEFQRA